MADFIKLHVSVTLKHILDRGPRLANDYSEDSDDSAGKRHDSHHHHHHHHQHGSKKKLLQRSSRRNKRPTTSSDQILDFEGPKLINGVKNWLTLYQLMGQINFIGRPLYVSIIFKLLVLALTFYVLITHHLSKLSELQIIDGSFKNPIFLFISFLAVLVFVAQVLTTLYVNLFDLCPMYKILTTPKLCFIDEATQHVIGSRSLNVFIFLHLYTALLWSLASHRSWTEFVNQFHLPTFLLDLYALTSLWYYQVGLSQMDLYIRCSFGNWLLALKSHLERQFTYLHRYQRRSLRSSGSCAESLGSASQVTPSGRPMSGNSTTGASNYPLKLPPMRLITLDEIQKNLNHMDDHLEVLRSIQNSSIVLINLNAFLGNGSMFLLIYHLMADQSNYYHGCLFLLLSLNYMLGIFLTYSGDRWVFYALSSFVQTVEDEYFMQSDIKTLEAKAATAPAPTPTPSPRSDSEGEQADDDEHLNAANSGHPHDANHMLQQLLLIKKKDVLFCREFLHQFENHLATPWSKLTFKSHLHMLRTFVTLIAAQIIFDHEH